MLPMQFCVKLWCLVEDINLVSMLNRFSLCYIFHIEHNVHYITTLFYQYLREGSSRGNTLKSCIKVFMLLRLHPASLKCIIKNLNIKKQVNYIYLDWFTLAYAHFAIIWLKKWSVGDSRDRVKAVTTLMTRICVCFGSVFGFKCVPLSRE